MEGIWQFYQNKNWVTQFLITAICVFALIAVGLFLTILITRRLKLRRQSLEKRFLPIIEHILNKNLFESAFFSEFSSYEKLFRNTVFRNLMIDSILNLHQNYEGTYAENLEVFYKDSGLVNDSYEKINSEHWQIKCKGINELAEMNIQEAFEALVGLSRSTNKTLTIVAINACIKLNSTNGIKQLAKHPHQIDFWTQLNILDALKQGKITQIHGIEILLRSKNKTVVSLGLKAISSLNLTEKTPFIDKLIENSKDLNLLVEAKETLNALYLQNNSNQIYDY